MYEPIIVGNSILPPITSRPSNVICCKMVQLVTMVMRLQTSTVPHRKTRNNHNVHSLETVNQCFCEVGEPSAIWDGQNVDLQLAGGGGGRTTPPIPPWLRVKTGLQMQ